MGNKLNPKVKYKFELDEEIEDVDFVMKFPEKKIKTIKAKIHKIKKKDSSTNKPLF